MTKILTQDEIFEKALHNRLAFPSWWVALAMRFGKKLRVVDRTLSVTAVLRCRKFFGVVFFDQFTYDETPPYHYNCRSAIDEKNS